MKHKIPYVIVQDTQAGGTSREICFLLDSTQISFFMTDRQLDKFVEAIKKEIDFNREIENELRDISTSSNPKEKEP